MNRNVKSQFELLLSSSGQKSILIDRSHDYRRMFTSKAMASFNGNYSSECQRDTHTNTGTQKERDVKMSQCTHSSSSISFVYKVNRKSLIPKKKKTSHEVTVTVQ